MKKVKIGEKSVGEGEPCFIIAEAGINHNGDIEIAKKMIDAAKDAGADAVKFQTFTAKEFIANEKEMYEYEAQGEKVKESMLKMFERHEFEKEQWKEISDYCKKKKIIFFSSPQNVSNLKVLMEIGVPAVKVGADDMVNLPLLEEYAKQGIPILISTGMAYMEEVEEAIEVIRKHNDQLVVFHCVSSYPSDLEELNLLSVRTLIEKYPDLVIGFSDHSEGSRAAIISTALGSKIFEKHFTLDKNMRGPDHRFSADPTELKQIVEEIRAVEVALGDGDKKPTPKEMEMRDIAHRSLVALKDLNPGDILDEENLGIKRPGTGIKPKHFNSMLGKKVVKEVKKDSLLSFDDVKDGN